MKSTNTGRENRNERKRSERKREGIIYDRKYSQDSELTNHRLVLNRKLRVHGQDSMSLDWDEFEDIPDICDLEK
jgi:hypothetical protein